jgi:hypothetical protein
MSCPGIVPGLVGRPEPVAGVVVGLQLANRHTPPNVGYLQPTRRRVQAQVNVEKRTRPAYPFELLFIVLQISELLPIIARGPSLLTIDVSPLGSL